MELERGKGAISQVKENNMMGNGQMINDVGEVHVNGLMEVLLKECGIKI